MAKRDHFGDVLRRGLGRRSHSRPGAPASACECEVCGHPGDVHPGSASQHRACAVCIWEADMGHRPQESCCQRRIMTPFHTEPRHLR